MQPLYSVDHETRQNSYRADDHTPTVSEDTPLLPRFPPAHTVERGPFMIFTASLLFAILITGVIIGIYLLILQSESENILPPVETPLQLVSRKQWDPTARLHPILSTSPVRVNEVIVVQTDTEQCTTTESCAKLLQRLQMNTNTTDKLLPYNFLLSTNGQTYEALGWHRLSPLFSKHPDSLVLAFIGNFTEGTPNKLQLDEAKNFFAESVSQQHLEPSYIVFGKSSAYQPTYLFSSLKTLPHWNSNLTDVLA